MRNEVFELRPLSRGYRREPGVVDEIRTLSGLSPELFWSRVARTDFAAPGAVRNETLVYFVRAFAAEGRRTEAWRVIETLEGRLGRMVGQVVSRLRGLTRDQIADMERNLATRCFEQWLSLEPQAEFWEVRFTVCLHREVFDAVDRLKRIEATEVVLTTEEAAEPGMDPLEILPDPNAPDPERRAMIAAALLELDSRERLALILRVRDRMTEEEVAGRLGVTPRTVRNYMHAAREKLRGWREERGGEHEERDL